MVLDAGESMCWFCTNVLMTLEEMRRQKWIVLTNFDFNIIEYKNKKLENTVILFASQCIFSNSHFQLI